MEKYSRWADLTTGINPFVPQRRRFQGGWPLTCVQVLAGSLLVAVRAPLLAVAALALALTNVVTSVLAVVPFLGRLLKRLTEWLLCSLLLLLLGVFASEEAANTRRLGLTTAKSGRSASGSARVSPGDVVVCNHTSFVEILYLARRFSPVFVFASEEGAAKGGLVHVCGLLEALYRSLAMPVALERATPRKIEDVVCRAAGPVVVLPEGARSNGKAVLRFLPVLQQLPTTKLRVHVVAFRYEFKHFSPSQSAGGGWTHVFWMTFHLYHTLRVTVLSAKDLNLETLAPSKPTSKMPSKTLTTPQVEKLRALLAAMLRAKTVDLGPQDFIEFNNYWRHVNGGGRLPAAQFTERKAPHEHAQWAKR